MFLGLEKIPPRSISVSILIGAATLTFDLITPLGVAGAIPYVAMVLCGLWAGNRSFTFVLACAASLLASVGYYLSPDGGISWVVLTNRGLAIFAIWVTALVIANRIEQARQCEINEKNLAQAQRIGRLGSWDWDMTLGTLAWSDEVYRIFGLRPQEFGATYETFLEFVHPDDRELVETAVQKALETGEQYEIEHRVVRKDGDLRHVIEHGEVYLDASGKPIAMRGTVHDVTEQKKAKTEILKLNRELEQRVEKRTTELREQMEFSERLIDTAQAIILVLDGEARIKHYNRYMENLTGFPLAEVVGKSWFETFIPEHDSELIQSKFGELLSVGNTSGIQNAIKTKAGKFIKIEWFSTTLTDSAGEITGTLSVGQDITERLKLQAQIVQSSKLATLGEMATGIAHELNQPLGIIGFATENLNKHLDMGLVDQEYASGKLKRILEQVARATEIIDHMRVFGRKPDAEPRPLRMSDALEGVMTLIGQQLKKDGVTVNRNNCEDCRPVLGHRVQVEQVLLNLINNARDAILAAPSGGTRRRSVSKPSAAQAAKWLC